MVVRRRRKKNRLRGHRTHGKGDTKNKRGAGSRGGRGRAGSHKHKYSMYQGQFGKEKKKIAGKRVFPAVNLDQLQEMLPKLVAEGKAAREGNTIVVDGAVAGLGKVLSMGALKEKVVFKNIGVSKKAREKILKAGGKVEEAAKEREKGKEESTGKAGAENEKAAKKKAGEKAREKSKGEATDGEKEEGEKKKKGNEEKEAEGAKK